MGEDRHREYRRIEGEDASVLITRSWQELIAETEKRVQRTGSGCPCERQLHVVMMQYTEHLLSSLSSSPRSLAPTHPGSFLLLPHCLGHRLGNAFILSHQAVILSGHPSSGPFTLTHCICPVLVTEHLPGNLIFVGCQNDGETHKDWNQKS